MQDVSADPVATLRAELRRSLLDPPLISRAWLRLAFGRVPAERPVLAGWRESGYRVGTAEAPVWRGQ